MTNPELTLEHVHMALGPGTLSFRRMGGEGGRCSTYVEMKTKSIMTRFWTENLHKFHVGTILTSVLGPLRKGTLASRMWSISVVRAIL